jgi:DHA1 family inner membrane transport protein
VIAGMVGAGLTFSFFSQFKIIAASCVFLFGFFTFIMVPFLQSRIIEKSSDLSSFSSVLHVASFNVGSGVGSMIAGILVTAGVTLTTIPIFVVIPGAIGTVLTLYNICLDGSKKNITEEDILSENEEALVAK